MNFHATELQKFSVRDEYRELIDLCIIYLGGDDGKKFKSGLLMYQDG